MVWVLGWRSKHPYLLWRHVWGLFCTNLKKKCGKVSACPPRSSVAGWGPCHSQPTQERRYPSTGPLDRNQSQAQQQSTSAHQHEPQPSHMHTPPKGPLRNGAEQWALSEGARSPPRQHSPQHTNPNRLGPQPWPCVTACPMSIAAALGPLFLAPAQMLLFLAPAQNLLFSSHQRTGCFGGRLMGL